MQRRTLPQRRRSLTATVRHEPFRLHLTLGYYADGALGEVFATDAAREGTDVQALTSDACVLLSLALQHGVPLETMVAAMSKSPRYGLDGATTYVPGSLLATIVTVMAEHRTLDMALADGEHTRP